METTTEAPVEAKPMMTRRELLLKTYGPGPRLCLDGAANWLGCDARCEQSCILTPGHQLDKEEIERRRAEYKARLEQQRKDERAVAKLRAEKQRLALRVKKALAREPQAKKAVARKPLADGRALHEAIAAVPAADLLPRTVKKCSICMVVMRPVMGRWVCPKCGGVLTPKAAG